ncbi:MAG TPA: alkaline phosphatase family protein [Egibacteraceae bacterium]|nr:alkaline phosphatase family protein [Actinomycetota bacterium]HWB72516.1 alkaline phosphatase family protein [Egibacteraceae bacterium]
MEPVRPDYAGAWIGAVVPALLGGQPATWLPEPTVGAASHVLLVLDGLGWHAIEGHRQRLPTLAAMAGSPVTAVAPSTTAAGLTSICTGLTPAEHGVVGYRMRVGGQVLNVLRWHGGDGWSPDPAGVQPIPPFLGKKVPVVTRAEFRKSGFTLAHLRGSRLPGWRTTATLVEHCRRLVDGGERFVYAYYDGVDKVSHEYGLLDGFFAAELGAADRLVADLLDVLPETCVLVVTADHGQVHVGTDATLELKALDPLIATYSGEGRFRSLHARVGAARDLLTAAQEAFGEVAWVFTRDQLFDEGWMGSGAAAEVRSRVGDVVLAARTATAFVDPTDPLEASLVGRHGSLTPDEMIVPLLAARGRR